MASTVSANCSRNQGTKENFKPFRRLAHETGLAQSQRGDRSRHPFRDGCSAVRVWCLWCLFGPEIGAIYAERLKELKKERP
jgi:hypothetical protein